MKKLFLLSFLAILVSTMIFSCKKDDTSNGGGSTPTPPPAVFDLTFTYNGVTYFGIEETSGAVLSDDHLVCMLNFASSNGHEDGGIEVRVRDLTTINHTIDLAHHDPAADFFFHILLNHSDSGCWFDLGHDNSHQSLYSGSYDGEGDPSCFSSGTAKFSIDNNVLYIDCEAIYVFTGKQMTLKGTVPCTVNNLHDENNWVVIDNDTCYLETTINVNDMGGVYFESRNDDKNIAFYSVIPFNSYNKTADITDSEAEEEYSVRLESEDLMFQQRNMDGQFSCILNGSYVEGPLFSEGSLTTTYVEGTDFTLVFSGTMTDGTTVAAKLKAPYTETILPLTENSIIYDGVKVDLTTNATIFDDGHVEWEAVNSENYRIYGTLQPYSENMAFTALHTLPNDYNTYHIDFNVIHPDVQIEFECQYTEMINSSLNGETVANPFSFGFVTSHLNDNNEMDYQVTGTLTNGKEIKFLVKAPVTME